jgi:GH43 family beta-xylosidase
MVRADVGEAMRRGGILVLVVSMFIAACSGEIDPGGGDEDDAARVDAGTGAPDGGPGGGGDEEAWIELPYQNPVVTGCADPGAVRVGDRFYLSCTGGTGDDRLPIYQSEDLVSWTRVGWVFPAGNTPSWAEGHYWAPELHEIPGGFAVYFSALAGGKHVIGVASAADVRGPYVDSGAPIVVKDYSVIDAHAFADDDGTRWLFWKGEGAPDGIYARKLREDGLALSPEGGARILSVDRAWEAESIEAPWVVHEGDWYYLFYSGAYYCNSSYGIGVARARSPLGPWDKRPEPLVTSADHWRGPGHNSIVEGRDGSSYVVYHGFRTEEGIPGCAEGTPGDNDTRHTLVDRVEFPGDWPVVYSDDARAALEETGEVTAVQVNIFHGGRFDTLDTSGPETYGTARRFAELLATQYKRTSVIGVQEITNDDNAEMIRQILEEVTGNPWMVRVFDRGPEPDALPAYEKEAIFWRDDVHVLEEDFGSVEVDQLDSGDGPRTRSLRFGGLLLRKRGTLRELAVATGKLVPLDRKRGGVVLDNDDRAAEATRLLEWLDEKLAERPDATRLIAVDTNSDFGGAPWSVLRTPNWDGDDDRPTHFTYGARRIDFLFWDMDAWARRTDGFRLGPFVSPDFGSDHLAVAARLYMRR